MKTLLRKLRRALSPLFRHQWQTEIVGVRVKNGVPLTMMICSKCSRRAEYPTLDLAKFAAVYRMRGCGGGH